MRIALQLSLWAYLVHGLAAAATGPYVRVEFELGILANANGILQNGGKCSILGKSCSQKVTGYVDTNPSSRGWPGSKSVDTWPEIISSKDNNISIKKVISGDFCSGSYKEGILRIHVVDTGLKDRLIEDFECRGGITVASSESKASWSSPESTCEAKYNGKNNRMEPENISCILAACARHPAAQWCAAILSSPLVHCAVHQTMKQLWRTILNEKILPIWTIETTFDVVLSGKPNN